LKLFMVNPVLCSMFDELFRGAFEDPLPGSLN
jgi:hypothetical protein